MKLIFKQSFKNMCYCWLISDIVKNSFFLFEGINVLFSFPAWEYTIHCPLVSKKIGKCDGRIGPGLWWAWMGDGSDKIVFR